MWPFKKKKPEKYPTLELHGLDQKLIFTYHPEIVFYVHQISYDYSILGAANIRIEASEL